MSTNEKIELTLQEFKVKFQRELQQAILSYSSHKQQKDMIKPLYFHRDIDCYKTDFYQSLIYNFNNYQTSLWFIEKII